ncbi:MAG: glucosamine-6-phosphate deaminase [Bacteroidales bacterium]|nr:glucosamine-6-phosphate deaminase [Bacteroidales bacterium]
MLLNQFYTDLLAVKLFDNRKALGEAAGKEAADCLRDLLSRKEEVTVLFAAAPSQNEFLAYLRQAGDIDWSRVIALHMDEYVGLAHDAPQGFGNFLRRSIFDMLPFKDVLYIDAGLSPEGNMARYDHLLSCYPIDVVFMGIGENGHIAFNDPHVADFHDPLRIKQVRLDEKCRNQQVHDGCFQTLEEVPEYALSLTCPVLFGADRLFCIVPAATKAEAVRNTVLGPVGEACPATILRRHPAATLYVDQDSGAYIR